MPAPKDEILLVTPVWKDSARLAVYGRTLAVAFAASPLPIRWIIADDGSGEAEAVSLGMLREEFSQVFPRVELYLADGHHGKGSVVRGAWALSPEAAWLAFVDADGSLEANELVQLIGTAVNADLSVVGVRKRTATTRVVESLWRAIAHRGFLLAAHLILNLKSEDIQCGAKVLKGDDYRRIAHRLCEDGLAFDSELLSVLSHSGARWLEVPVTWIEKKGGKVRPMRDAWGMLAALWRVRTREW